MFELRAFGGLTLLRDGTPLDRVNAQRKALALLAVLAASGEAGIGREKLMALFWPDSDADRARGALKQMLHTLRRHLANPDAILGTAELRLSAAHVSSDIARFRRALADGDLEAAVAEYGGPFLDSVHVGGAPEFTAWADSQRAELARHYRDALDRLAGEAEARLDTRRAVAWLRQLQALEPLDGGVAVRLMTALEAAGDRAAALRHARVHETLLREEWGLAAAPAVLELADRLRSAPSVTSEEPPAGPGPLATQASGPVPAQAPADSRAATQTELVPRRVGHLLGRAAAVVVVCALAAAVVMSLARRPGSTLATRGDGPISGADAPTRIVVAVLPFGNLGSEPDAAYLAEGLSYEIRSRLSLFPDLTVISTTSSLRYRERRETLLQIVGELRVTHVLEGSVQRADGRVRVTAFLVDARHDRQLWSESYDRDLADVLGIQTDIARRVAAALGVRLTSAEERRLGAMRPPNSTAYDFYLRGRDYFSRFTRRDNEVAIGLFRRAIAADSTFAHAWAGLAEAFLLADSRFGQGQEWTDSSFIAAERAVSIDPDLAEARSALGWVYSTRGESARSVAEYERALELNPNYALALINLGAYWANPDPERALSLFRRAIEVEPTHALAWSWIADYCSFLELLACADHAMANALAWQPDWILVMRTAVGVSLRQGRMDEAQARREQMMLMEDVGSAHYTRAGDLDLFRGDVDSAREHFEKAHALFPNSLSYSGRYLRVMLASTLWNTDRPRARRLLDEFRSIALAAHEKGTAGFTYQYGLATAYSIEGAHAEAMKWLEQALTLGFFDHWLLMNDPLLESVRKQPEFQPFAERVRARKDAIQARLREVVPSS